LFDREHVELPDGRVLEFDPKPLSEDCPDRIHDPGTRGKAARVSLRIRRAIEDVRRASDPSWTGGDERLAAGASAQELLDEELAGGGYELEGDRVEGDEYRSGLQERFLEWWEELLRGFEPESQQPVPQGQPWLPSFDGRWLMAAIALLLAGVILVFLLGQTGRLRPGVPELDLGRQDFGGDLPDARVRSPLAWREHADALMAEGLTREAMRAQFLAVLARLDRTREIDYRTERTNGEHLRSFRGGAERRTLFVDATRLFEIAWYGAGEVGQADYGLLTASCDPLILDDPAPVAAAGALAGGDPSEQGRAHA